MCARVCGTCDQCNYSACIRETKNLYYFCIYYWSLKSEEEEAKQRQNETRLLAWCVPVCTIVAIQCNTIRFFVGVGFCVCVCKLVRFYCSHFSSVAVFAGPACSLIYGQVWTQCKQKRLEMAMNSFAAVLEANGRVQGDWSIECSTIRALEATHMVSEFKFCWIFENLITAHGKHTARTHTHTHRKQADNDTINVLQWQRQSQHFPINVSAFDSRARARQRPLVKSNSTIFYTFFRVVLLCALLPLCMASNANALG